jgi:hypothetical protein
MGFFNIGSHELFAQSWLPTMLLPISTSQVDRIIGVSHKALPVLSSSGKGMGYKNSVE